MKYVIPNDDYDEDDDVIEGGDEIVDMGNMEQDNAVDDEEGDEEDDGVDDGDSDEDVDEMEEDEETA